MKWQIIQGDSLDALRLMADDSADSLVCDPPAGIGFMGRDWDRDKGGRDQWIAWLAAILREAYRVLKPGAHGLVWALPRTSHWTGMACEDAGFEVRDKVVHLFGSGFPKSLNLGNGWGTALKPAAEDWWLIRKPLRGTVAANVQQFGTGALNIEGCRIASNDGFERAWDQPVRTNVGAKGGAYITVGVQHAVDISANKPSGRWPAHLVLSHTPDCTDDACAAGCAVAMLDEQSGMSKDGVAVHRNGHDETKRGYDGGWGVGPRPDQGYGGQGGASRFFYCAKPSSAEREVGCDGLPKSGAGELVDRQEGSAGMSSPRAGAGRTSAGRGNTHPTVKSVDLMRWLVRLITPPNGIVLDPFAGSGTTGIAALLERCRFVGIELDPHHADICRARISAAERGDIHTTSDGSTKLREPDDPRQVSLLDLA